MARTRSAAKHPPAPAPPGRGCARDALNGLPEPALIGPVVMTRVANDDEGRGRRQRKPQNGEHERIQPARR